MRTGGREASWGKREKKEENAPIVDRKRKSELGQKREKRGSCSNRGLKVEERVGAKVRKNRKMLQLWIGREKASWSKSEEKEENTPIVDRK